MHNAASLKGERLLVATFVAQHFYSRPVLNEEYQSSEWLLLVECYLFHHYVLS